LRQRVGGLSCREPCAPLTNQTCGAQYTLRAGEDYTRATMGASCSYSPPIRWHYDQGPFNDALWRIPWQPVHSVSQCNGWGGVLARLLGDRPILSVLLHLAPSLQHALAVRLWWPRMLPVYMYKTCTEMMNTTADRFSIFFNYN
jgi:hypothetical protein